MQITALPTTQIAVWQPIAPSTTPTPAPRDPLAGLQDDAVAGEWERLTRDVFNTDVRSVEPRDPSFPVDLVSRVDAFGLWTLGSTASVSFDDAVRGAATLLDRASGERDLVIAQADGEWIATSLRAYDEETGNAIEGLGDAYTYVTTENPAIQALVSQRGDTKVVGDLRR